MVGWLTRTSSERYRRDRGDRDKASVCVPVVLHAKRITEKAAANELSE